MTAHCLWKEIQALHVLPLLLVTSHCTWLLYFGPAHKTVALMTEETLSLTPSSQTVVSSWVTAGAWKDLCFPVPLKLPLQSQVCPDT